jgi:hypothetical protein
MAIHIEQRLPDVQCAWCKRVCWDRAYSNVRGAWHEWSRPCEVLNTSHGCCPDCADAVRASLGGPHPPTRGGDKCVGQDARPTLDETERQGLADDGWEDARRVEAARTDAR